LLAIDFKNSVAIGPSFIKLSFGPFVNLYLLSFQIKSFDECYALTLETPSQESLFFADLLSLKTTFLNRNNNVFRRDFQRDFQRDFKRDFKRDFNVI